MGLNKFAVVCSLAVLAALSACDGGASDPGADSTGALDSAAGHDAATGDDGGPQDSIASDSAGPDSGAPDATADTSPTPDATADVPANPLAPPAPAAYSGAACPTLQAGPNSFMSSGLARSVQVWLPPTPAGAGVMFLWHGFGDTGANFGNAVGAAAIAKNYGVIVASAQAVLDPLASEKLAEFKDLGEQLFGEMPPTWSLFDGPGIDLVLFDDLLSCLDETFAIDRTRVHTMGFSAGALWSTVLLLERSEWLASAVLWSGGLGSTGGFAEVVYTPYETPARDLPVLAVSGGPADVWPSSQFPLVDFVTGSDELTADLTADGHDVVRCDHGLGHTIPPDGMSWGLNFLFDHHWRVEGGTLYKSLDGLPFPAYCAIELGAE